MTARWTDNLSFSTKQRLQFFEAMLLWEGSANRGRMSEVFELSKNHVTRELKTYRERRRGQIEYSTSKRAYIPRKSFKPIFATGSAEEYLALLRAYVESESNAVVPALGPGVTADVVARPRGAVNQEILTVLVRALQQAGGLTMSYQSLSRPAPRSRTIWPHALVSAGDRWHARAYDNLNQGFRDFVLSRIIKAVPISATRDSSADPEADTDWQERETIGVIPAKGLSNDQQRVIAQEYGMQRTKQGFMWRVTMRRCLIPYFLSQHRLDLGRDAQSAGRWIDLEDMGIRDQYAFKSLKH